MFCDRCGQVDQSIAISALRALDAGPQFSQSAGGIIHEGEYTPLMATHMQGIDSELVDLQIRASKYARGEDYLKEIGSTQRAVSAIEANPDYKTGITMLLAGIGTLLAGLLAALFGQPLVGTAIIVAGISLIVLGIRRADKGAKPIAQANRNALTADQKQHLQNVANGSYCRRCNIFSPEHD